MENDWKATMNTCTALWGFLNFCYLTQSEINTHNTKVSIVLHSNMLVGVVAFVLIWTVSGSECQVNATGNLWLNNTLPGAQQGIATMNMYIYEMIQILNCRLMNDWKIWPLQYG